MVQTQSTPSPCDTAKIINLLDIVPSIDLFIKLNILYVVLWIIALPSLCSTTNIYNSFRCALGPSAPYVGEIKIW